MTEPKNLASMADIHAIRILTDFQDQELTTLECTVVLTRMITNFYVAWVISMRKTNQKLKLGPIFEWFVNAIDRELKSITEQMKQMEQNADQPELEL